MGLFGFSAGQSNNYLCVPCRKAWKVSHLGTGSWNCPSCGGPGRNMYTKFRPPALKNRKAWKFLDEAWARWLVYDAVCREYDLKHFGTARPSYHGHEYEFNVGTYAQNRISRESLPEYPSFLWDEKAKRRRTFR